jgi:hypothetical protein
MRMPMHALRDRLLAAGAGIQISDHTALRRFAAALAWAALIFVAYATMSPIALRPHLGSFVQLERFGAFMIIGFLFALAYRRRPLLVLALMAALALGLEAFQFLAPGRHARLLDLLIKASGGAFGVFCGWLATSAPLKWALGKPTGNAPD